MNQQITALQFDSVDQLQHTLQDLYKKQGLATVKEWVSKNFTKGRKLILKKGQSGQQHEEVEICDRKMETLDKNGIKTTNPGFLPFISDPVNYDTCQLYFSLRVLFIEEPFGLVIYKKTD